MGANRSNYRTMSSEPPDGDEQAAVPRSGTTVVAETESLLNDVNGHARPLLPVSSSNPNDDDDADADANYDANYDALRAILPTLIISILLGLVSGTLYGFGRYARRLKKVLNFTQSQVQRLGICMDCGNYVGHPLTGLIYDRKGPVFSCLVAAVVVFVGYWRIRWTMLNHHHEEEELSPADSFWLNLAFSGVGFGSGLGYISGLGSTTKALLKLSSNGGGSSSEYFGTGIGLVAASYGLSSTLVGLTYHYLPGLPSFFLFWALIVPTVNLSAATMFSRQAKEEEQVEEEEEEEIEEESLAGSLPESSMQRNLSFSDMVRLSSLNLEDPLVVELDAVSHASHGSHAGSHAVSNPNNSTTFEELATGEDAPGIAAWDSWKKLEFWLLFASFSCASGCGLLVINNLSTMVQSMGGSDSLAGTLIIVLSISNVCGRVLMGILGDSRTSTSPSLRRIWLLQGVNLTMVIAMILGYIGGQHKICLAIMVIMVALAYGGSWVLIVALASNLFGQDHFGKDYGLLALGPALSGLIFNEASARWYEEHAPNNTCIGRECYQTAYLAAGVVALMGNVVTSILYKTQLRKEH